MLKFFNKKTIQEQYQLYSDLVVPADAGITQKTETQRAFYAGAQSILYIMLNMCDENISDEAFVGILQGLCDETDAYAKSIIGVTDARVQSA